LLNPKADRCNNLYKEGAISQDQAQQYNDGNRIGVRSADREAITNALLWSRVMLSDRHAEAVATT
jgi:hypothetical protein